MMSIYRGRIKGSIAEEADRVYVERFQAVAQNLIEEKLVDLAQLGCGAALTRTRAASARFLETILVKVFRCGAADDVTSQCFEQWKKSDTFMNAAVEQIVAKPFFILPVGGSIKQHNYEATDLCDFTELSDESRKVDETVVPRSPRSCSSNATDKLENTFKREGCKHQRLRREKAHRKDLDHQNGQEIARPAAQGHRRLRVKRKSCIEAMEYQAHDRQNYLVRRSAGLSAETQSFKNSLQKK